MEILVGVLLALGVGAFATAVGFDRGRSFYPVILVVIASYYDLFAVMGGSAEALGLETVVLAGFVALAVVGFKTNLWLVVAALLAHGGLDAIHGHVIVNPGVPVWWPRFCMAYDVAAAGYMAGLLLLVPKARPNRIAIDAELRRAEACEARGAMTEAFGHLERAHVLGQSSTVPHVRVHVRMLQWSIRQRDPREAAGQILRILGAAALTPAGLVPIGNTGGSNVSPLRAMPIPEDLAELIEKAPRENLRRRPHVSRSGSS